MANEKEVTIKVTLDSKGAVKGAAKVKDSVRDVGDQSKKSTSKLSGFTNQLKMMAVVATGAAAAAMTTLIKRGIDLAQEVEETASKYETVLGPSVDMANEFLRENATLMGLSVTQGREMVATTTAIAQGFGFEGEAAAELGTEVVKLAGDLQSFNDVPIERTHNAITSALSGETEALKSLGIVIRQEMVTQRALEQTGKDTVDALTQQERATATLALITEKAGVAVGDLERTQDSAANRSRQVRAELQNVSEILSMKLTGSIQGGLDVLEPFVGTLKDWVETPLSDQIRKEQTELNLLVGRITEANIEQDERNRLISDLEDKYPGFLENLDSEKVTNKELAGRMEEVNQQFVRRIALQSQEEEVARAVEEQARATRQQFQAELAVRREAMRINEEYGLGIDSTNMTLDEFVNTVRESIKSQAEFTEGGLASGVAANEQAGDYNRLRRRIGDYTVASNNVSQAQDEVQRQFRISDEVIKRMGMSAEESAEQLDKLRGRGGGGDQPGGTVTFSTEVDTRGLGSFENVSGEDVTSEDVEKTKQKIKERRKQREEEQRNVEILQGKLVQLENSYDSVSVAAGVTGDTTVKAMNKSEDAARAGANATLMLADALLQAGLQGQDLLGIVGNLARQLASRTLLTGLKFLLGFGSGSFLGSVFGFAGGGELPKAQRGLVLRGPSHKNGGVGITVRSGPQIEAEGGEAIINKRSTTMYRDELSAINQAGGGRAFSGTRTVNAGKGFFNSPSLPVNRGGRGMDIGAITAAVRKGIEQARIYPQVEISSVRRELNDYDNLNERIGN